MNNSATAFFASLHKKSIAVAGVGVSHRPLLRRLVEAGAVVTAYDHNPDILRDEWESLGVTLCLGSDCLRHDSLQKAELIFRSPSLRPDHPSLLQAASGGGEITTEIDCFLRLAPCPVIGVTGSDGKTTTASLIAAMLEADQKTVWLGGNIGVPLLTLAERMRPEDICVAELSSFQLMDAKHSPQRAVVTNLYPNHLDWHQSMEEYIKAKRNILRYQATDDLAVLNDDNDQSAQLHGVGQTVRFGGYMVADGLIDGLIPLDSLRLRGWHNAENVMAALCAVRGLASEEAIVRAAAEFSGVKHRDQWVACKNGVDYFNDSIASSPSRTAATLRAHPGKVILIAGGRGKNLSFAPLAELCPAKVSTLLLIGEAAEEIAGAVGAQPDAPPIIHCGPLKQAVAKASRLAKPGDTVLLSPACTSFDAYKNFEERGEEFCQLVIDG